MTCWRCRGPILPDQPWDVGHVPGALGSAVTDLAPEHRHATDRCPGNRAEGGRAGATIRHARRAPITTPPATVTRYPM